MLVRTNPRKEEKNGNNEAKVDNESVRLGKILNSDAGVSKTVECLRNVGRHDRNNCEGKCFYA